MNCEQFTKLCYYAKLMNCTTVGQLAEHLKKISKTAKDIIQ